ncbi:hypothetical protein D0D70_25550 [Vibrio parahaemolyticus]|nr:hypothetical protein [Vibrio parahaemolyticus]
MATNAALRCEQRLATLERSETAKRCESLLNALLGLLRKACTNALYICPCVSPRKRPNKYY